MSQLCGTCWHLATHSKTMPTKDQSNHRVWFCLKRGNTFCAARNRHKLYNTTNHCSPFRIGLCLCINKMGAHVITRGALQQFHHFWYINLNQACSLQDKRFGQAPCVKMGHNCLPFGLWELSALCENGSQLSSIPSLGIIRLKITPHSQVAEGPTSPDQAREEEISLLG